MHEANNKTFIIRARAIIMHEGKLLVVKHPHDPSFAALPGGHLEWGEDIRECMKREIVEELGIEPVIGRLLYINTFLDGSNIQPIEFFFEVTNGEDYVDTNKLNGSHDHEIAGIYWVGPADDMRILPRELADDLRAGKIGSGEVRFISGKR